MDVIDTLIDSKSDDKDVFRNIKGRLKVCVPGYRERWRWHPSLNV